MCDKYENYLLQENGADILNSSKHPNQKHSILNLLNKDDDVNSFFKHHY